MALLFCRRPETRWCGVKLPVIATVNGHAVHGLDSDGFLISTKENSLPATSADVDARSRRILFVLYTGSKLTGDEKKLSAHAVENVLRSARKGDSFALFAAGGGALRKVQFGDSPEVLERSLTELQDNPKEKSPALDSLELIRRSLDFFGPSEWGDSIFFLGPEFPPGNSKEFDETLRVLRQKQLRLFAAQFGSVLAGTFTGFSPIFLNKYNLVSLAGLTGGTLMVVDQGSWNNMKFTPENLKTFSQELQFQYTSSAEIYWVTFPRPNKIKPGDWKLELSHDILAKQPAMQLSYPQELPLCPISGSGG